MLLHVVAAVSNCYFTLEDYSIHGKGTDAKMRIRPAWHTAEPQGMGGAYPKSKTLQILSMDSDFRFPTRTYLALRCWSLWRSSQGTWLGHRAARQRWFDSEKQEIRNAIQALGLPTGTTGSKKADSLIEQWLPDVLQ